MMQIELVQVLQLLFSACVIPAMGMIWQINTRLAKLEGAAEAARKAEK